MAKSAERERVYLAGPLGFSEAGRDFQERVLLPELNRLGFEVINPWKLTEQGKINAILAMPYGQTRRIAWRKLNVEIGHNNQDGIDRADAVLAILDGVDVDSGTASEIGYAFAHDKRIIGYRGDFRLSADNEGSTVNLQVEYFIRANGGDIVSSVAQLEEALSRLPKFAPLAHASPSRSVLEFGEKMEYSKDILDAIAFFKQAFTIILALALGEAFKQFVADRADKPEDRVLHWDRVLALFSFLLLIVPFYQGMSRYFFITYSDPAKFPQPYSAFLMFDGFAFMCESALFFIMSRALSLAQWRRYYCSVLVLLAVDSLWGVVAQTTHGTAIAPWIYLNVVFGIVLIIILFVFRHEARSYYASSFGLAAMFVRTFFDYYFSWNFYFP